MAGAAGNDRIDSGPGNDRLDGGSGQDTLTAGGGSDCLWVQDGVRDVLDGGRAATTRWSIAAATNSHASSTPSRRGRRRRVRAVEGVTRYVEAASGSSTRKSAPPPGARRGRDACRRAPRRSRRRSRGRGRRRRSRASATCRRGRSGRRRAPSSSVGEARALVAHLEHGRAVRRVETRTCAGVSGGVCERTLPSRLSSTRRRRARSPSTDRRLDLQVERPRRVERARRLDRLGGELVELDRLALERLALVEPREQQQVLDELLHPVALAA